MTTDTTTLFLGVLFGAFGMGFVAYARRQRRVVPLLSGLGLFVVPYVTERWWLVLLLGALLVVLPFMVRE